MSKQVKTDPPFPIVAVSTEPEEKAKKFAHESNLEFEVVYGLSDNQARNLGLYISNPLASVKTYRPFAEPGMLFTRPDLEMITMGIAVI